MCGIVGLIGKGFETKQVLNLLKKLEYRGYDSAGIAYIKDKEIVIKKSVGSIDKLIPKVKPIKINAAISHTRWATHGIPNTINAHPHTDCKNKIALVHNGIIENFEEIKETLKNKGHEFKSETDSEVIAHLIEENYKGDLKEAVLKSVNLLKGSFALAILSSEEPERIIGVRKGSPLVFGLSDDFNILASDITPILKYTKQVYFMDDKEVVILSKNDFEVLDFEGNAIKREPQKISWNEESAEKQGFKHFMLKEIYEEPETIKNALAGRISNNEVYLKEIKDLNLGDIDKIKVIACGTSYNAGLVFKYFLEKHLNIDIDVEFASEFRYKKISPSEKSLVIAISQSGETADTLESIRMLKDKGIKVIAVSNVVGSTISRESDVTIYINAGPEIGVAATKTYVNQLIVLYLLALEILRKKNAFDKGVKEVLKSLIELPEIIKKIIERSNIKPLAKKYKKYHHFMYIGRGINYPSALEGALKLKEISYINANAYPAGELKHGAIALLNRKFPIFAIAPKDKFYSKMKSNIEECKARNAKIVAITSEGNKELEKICDDVIYVPKANEDIYPIIISPIIQLFAYYISSTRGYNPDKPRNLAKSVTVE
ncbi:MAG: hypothetical protein PWR32_196 [Candidatus Woesearchaeota archaeon]|nr:hypothetical protein [Candidatus Woesearchaeota archaeon]